LTNNVTWGQLHEHAYVAGSRAGRVNSLNSIGRLFCKRLPLTIALAQFCFNMMMVVEVKLRLPWIEQGWKNIYNYYGHFVKYIWARIVLGDGPLVINLFCWHSHYNLKGSW